MVSLDEILAGITAGLCEAIDWVDCASICVRCESGLDTLGATDPLPHKAEATQYELDQGPSVSVAPGEPVVYSDDVVSDSRWPRYALVAAELGVRSQAGVLVPTGRTALTVLNAYSRSSQPLDRRATELMRLFAHQAATAIDSSSRLETLTTAMERRQVISEAIGLVMERFGLDESRAFAYLVRVSQASQVKLRVVAHELIAAANARDDGQNGHAAPFERRRDYSL